MQAAREVEGLDVLADTTPFRDGLGQMAGILPPWVLADGWEEALQAAARPGASASGCAASATATGASSTRATGTACACRRARSTRASRARTSTRSRRCSARASGTRYFEILAASGPAIESLLLIGELFTDEHLAEMISHPLFSLGVDGYTSALDAGLDGVAGHPVCFAGHVHYLTHHVRRARDAAARGGDPQDDEHAGASTSASPTAASSRPGMAADVVVLDLDRLADGSTLEHPLAYVEGVDEVLVNGVAGRRRPASTRARGPGATSRACEPDRSPLGLLRAADRGDVGGDARGEARLGGRRRRRERERARAARGGAARQGGGRLRPDVHDGEPRGAARARPAAGSRSCSSASAHVLDERGGGISELAGLVPFVVDGDAGRLDPGEVDRGSGARARRCSASRTRTRARAAR